MKPVRCSWVDMNKIRDALSAGRHGDQAALTNMKCVDEGTVSKWKAACDVLGVAEAKLAISQVSTFQPSHATELAQHMRKVHGKKVEDWPAEEVTDWIDVCESQQTTVSEFAAMLRESRIAKMPPGGEVSNGRVVTNIMDLVNDGEQFGCIYADPPWGYENQGTRAATKNHYDTMTVEDIKKLPVGELALPQSHLWLWTTNAFLFDCPQIFEAWGFEFKSSYIWVKPQIGIGNYLRNAHEFLLLGVRGGLTGASKDVRSWGEFDRGEHSAKPDRIRFDVVERLSPHPYLELFGRKEVSNWTVWGNQVQKLLVA